MWLVIGVTGASGAVYALRLLEELHQYNIDTDLIITPSAEYNIKLELGLEPKNLAELATRTLDIYDTSADIASGSLMRDGMVIVPCTMNVVAKIAHGIADNLLLRCCDVMLKEQRRVVIVPRELPLHENHLENLLRVRRLGAIILPPMTTFYHNPKTIGDIINFVIARILDQFGIKHELIKPWEKK